MTIGKYLLLIILIFVLDLPWILLTQSFVSKMLGDALVLRPLPALVVYLALAYLAMLPKSAVEAFSLGLAVYTVYDFTNLATLKTYDWRFAFADSVWGGILFTLVFYLNQRTFLSGTL
jgi:uncharacterized membrane protein